jgi:hypothetical protein
MPHFSFVNILVRLQQAVSLGLKPVSLFIFTAFDDGVAEILQTGWQCLADTKESCILLVYGAASTKIGFDDTYFTFTSHQLRQWIG